MHHTIVTFSMEACPLRHFEVAATKGVHAHRRSNSPNGRPTVSYEKAC